MNTLQTCIRRYAEIFVSDTYDGITFNSSEIRTGAETESFEFKLDITLGALGGTVRDRLFNKFDVINTALETSLHISHHKYTPQNATDTTSHGRLVLKCKVTLNNKNSPASWDTSNSRETPDKRSSKPNTLIHAANELDECHSQETTYYRPIAFIISKHKTHTEYDSAYTYTPMNEHSARHYTVRNPNFDSDILHLLCYTYGLSMEVLDNHIILRIVDNRKEPTGVGYVSDRVRENKEYKELNIFRWAYIEKPLHAIFESWGNKTNDNIESDPVAELLSYIPRFYFSPQPEINYSYEPTFPDTGRAYAIRNKERCFNDLYSFCYTYGICLKANGDILDFQIIDNRKHLTDVTRKIEVFRLEVIYRRFTAAIWNYVEKPLCAIFRLWPDIEKKPEDVSSDKPLLDRIVEDVAVNNQIFNLSRTRSKYQYEILDSGRGRRYTLPGIKFQLDDEYLELICRFCGFGVTVHGDSIEFQAEDLPTKRLNEALRVNPSLIRNRRAEVYRSLNSSIGWDVAQEYDATIWKFFEKHIHRIFDSWGRKTE